MGCTHTHVSTWASCVFQGDGLPGADRLHKEIMFSSSGRETATRRSAFHRPGVSTVHAVHDTWAAVALSSTEVIVHSKTGAKSLTYQVAVQTNPPIAQLITPPNKLGV
jgi:hypothetical protein